MIRILYITKTFHSPIKDLTVVVSYKMLYNVFDFKLRFIKGWKGTKQCVGPTHRHNTCACQFTNVKKHSSQEPLQSLFKVT